MMEDYRDLFNITKFLFQSKEELEENGKVNYLHVSIKDSSTNNHLKSLDYLRDIMLFSSYTYEEDKNSSVVSIVTIYK